MNNYHFDYNQYKKKIHKPFNVSIIFLVVCILILTAVAGLVIKTPNYVEFYFVEVDRFLNYSEASSLAAEIQAQNAGGYIYFDNTYHVLANAYLTKEDAKKISLNLKEKYKNCCVFTLKTQKFNKNMNKYEKNAVEEVISANEKIIENLYNLTIKSDSLEINQTQLKIEISNLKNSYQSDITSFNTTFKTNNKINTAKENIATIYKSLESDLNGWKLKYNLINIIINHYSFLEFFSWFLFFFISTICQIPSPIKNNANSFFKTTLPIWLAINAPIKLNIQPTTASSHVSL